MAIWYSDPVTFLYTNPAITGTVSVEYLRSGGNMIYQNVTVTVSGISGYSYFGYSIVCNGATLKNSSPSQWSAFSVNLGAYQPVAVNSGTVTQYLNFSSNSGNSNVVALVLPVIEPSPPGVPPSITVTPTTPAPGTTTTITTGSSTAGTAGVAAYEISYRKNSGAWAVLSGSGLSRGLTLSGYVHGDAVTARSRAYCTVNGVNYWSGYRTSGTYTVRQPASGVPYNLAIEPQDPAPDEPVMLSWALQDVVNGFEVNIYKNGILAQTLTGIQALSKQYDLTGWGEEDMLSFSVRTYRTSGSATIYSEWAQVTQAIPVRSRIFCFASHNGGLFAPHRVILIEEDRSQTELRKSGLGVITGDASSAGVRKPANMTGSAAVIGGSTNG